MSAHPMKIPMHDSVHAPQRLTRFGEWLRSLGLALLLFLVVRTFLFQTFTIISASMESTIKRIVGVPGDVIAMRRSIDTAQR